MMISRVTGVAAPTEPGETAKAKAADSPSAMLLFFTRRTSGPARRMASLVAWVEAREKRRLRVVEVDADENAGLAERLLVSDVPTIVLVKDRRAVGRLQGRVTGVQIERLIDAHLAR